MTYTDKLIEELIKCPKKIVEAPKVVSYGRNSYGKKVFTLISTDESQNFKGFITTNGSFAENFSIGLVHDPRGERGTIVLCRINGIHGGTSNDPHHAYPHIHLATEERISQGLKPEGKIIKTTSYSTLETAIQFYVNYIGIVQLDRSKHFPPPSGQINLGL